VEVSSTFNFCPHRIEGGYFGGVGFGKKLTMAVGTACPRGRLKLDVGAPPTSEFVSEDSEAELFRLTRM
jgi:hypothetical protein